MTAALQSETQSAQTTDAATENAAARPSVRVIESVAEVTGADPLAMAPLTDVVDPDALDRLVAAEIEGHVSFEFCGQAVTVHGDGTVVVDEGGD